jgi:Tfp pilus assembly protein PilO
MTYLPPWASRFAAAALLVAVIFVLYATFFHPIFRDYGEVNEKIERDEALLNRFETIANSQAALRAHLEELTAQQAQSGVFLSGENNSLAAAQLQDLVNRTVLAEGGKLRSVQILPVDESQDFSEVGVRLQMTATLAAFARILYAFESNDEFLFVDNIDVSNRRARRRRNQDEESEPELLIRMDLAGYLRPGGG